MKPAIHYTLRNYYGGWFTMAVTSQRGTRCWGRDDRGDPTNARLADCKGRFATRDQAEKAKSAIDEIWKRFRNLDKAEDRERAARHRQRDAEIASVIERATRTWETPA